MANASFCAWIVMRFFLYTAQERFCAFCIMFLFNKEKYKLSNCFCRQFEKLEADAELASSSVKKYKEIAGRIVSELGDVDVRSVDTSTITKMKQSLNLRNLSPARKNHYLVTLRSLLKFMREIEKQKVMDYAEIKKFKEEYKPVEFLTDDEVKILLNSVTETSLTRMRLKTLIICLLSTGARISEIMNLDIADIDFEKGLAITKGKGGKINQIIFNELSLKYLKMYLGKRNDNCPALFATNLTKSPRRWQINCAERAVRNQGRNAGIKKRVYCHLMRKTAASKMFFSGAPLPIVARFLAHSDLATTQKYYLRGASFSEVNDFHKKTMSFSYLEKSQE